MIGKMHPPSQFMILVKGTSEAKSRLDSVYLILRHRRERFSKAFLEGKGRFSFRSAHFAAIYGTQTKIVNREGPEHDDHTFAVYFATMLEACLSKSLLLSSVLSSDKYTQLDQLKDERTCLKNRTDKESLDLLK